MIEISKDFEFEAAHSLPHLHFTHKCHNLHGHSYKLRVTCAGDIDPLLGWVVDYADISKAVAPVILTLDHSCLDRLFIQPVTNPPLSGGAKPKFLPSTAENLAVWVFKQIKPSLAQLISVRIKETSSSSAIYRPV